MRTISSTSRDSDSPRRPRFMPALVFLLLAAALAGCKPKAGSTAAGGAAGGNGTITGIPGFQLGSNLAENFDLKPQEDGSLMYFDPNYTNMPPFETLSVFATAGRQIYSIQLKSPPGVDPEVCGALAKTLAGQYGNRQDQNDTRYRTTTFGNGDPTCTLRLAYADTNLELTYTTTQTNH